MAYINLYVETTQVLKDNNKTWDDVRCLLIRDKALQSCFASQVLDINYYNGYGSEDISLDFKVVGDDWWLERAEYDGSEWWEYKTRPKVPELFNCDTLEFAKLLLV